jgi:hypothetical protein
MFLMLSMLGGLGAIALPVIVHLLHRQQTTPIQWGAMRFLMESPLQQKRRRFIEHWLLLLVRMLVLGLLVLALARPLFNHPFATPLGGGGGTDFAVVLDHSLSTSRLAPDGKSAFAKSVEYVDQMSRSLSPRDTLAIILAEHTPQPLSDHPASRGSTDLEKTRTALNSLKPGLTDAHIADAVQSARQIVNRGRGAQKKIIIIGDDQKSGWQLDNPAAWKAATTSDAGPDRNLSLFDLAIPIDAAPANIAISALEIQPRVISPNHPVQITATLSRTGASSLPAIPLELSIDGKRVNTQSIGDLPPGTSRTVQFDCMFQKAGSHAVTLRATVADALEADKNASLPVNVIEKLPVLIIDGQLTSAGAFQRSQFLLAAMQPEEDAAASSLLKPTVISLSDAPQASFASYAAVVLNDVPSLPPPVLARLYDYAESGHGVWIILGSHSLPTFMTDGLTKSGLFTATFAAARTIDREPLAILLHDPHHPTVSVLADSSKSPFAGATATTWWPITTSPADARAILTTQSGDPLVLDRPIGPSGGHVVLWTSSADGRTNTLPLLGTFVPLVQETLLHLAGPSVGATYGHQLESGQSITHTSTSSQKIISASLSRSGDPGSIPTTLSTRGGRTTIRSEDTFAPGLYEMRFVPSEIPQPIYYTVALPPREFDPALVSESDIEWLKQNASLKGRLTEGQLSSIMAAPGSGQELWPMLAIGVLALLLLETFVTYRMIKLQATPPSAGSTARGASKPVNQA